MAGIRPLAEACGADFVTEVGPEVDDAGLWNAFRTALRRPGLGVLIVRKPCTGVEDGKQKRPSWVAEPGRAQSKQVIPLGQ